MFPRSNLVNAGPNLVHQRSVGSNLVYCTHAVHAGPNLVQQSASLAASDPSRSNLAHQRANLGEQQVQMLPANFAYLPNEQILQN